MIDTGDRKTIRNPQKHDTDAKTSGYESDISMIVRISRTLQDAITGHAMAEYPYECCGYITGTDNSATWTAHRSRNIQNELHADDPVRYPRDARTAYVFDPESMERLLGGVFDDPNTRVVGLYHSHPDHPAYFSEKDSEEALTGWFDPEPFYFVVSVEAKDVRDIRAFRWLKEKDRFEMLKVEIVG
ncbi:MAG: M67 family metallopeptidase [candidate division Zixibacteria bacterium]|nr:M67 family metallopeptidase [candidate division Zixibacteria bacterium]